MSCKLCQSKTETRNIDLYVFGSEGLTVCYACEMALVNFARELSSLAGRLKLNVFKAKESSDGNN